jgi:hypothetical protein
MAAALDAGPFSAHSWLRGSSCFLAWRHGVAWRCSPRFALALAGRLVTASQEVRGGADGACSYDQDGHDLRGTAGLRVDVSQRALGYSGEACVDFFPAAEVVLSLTCELATPLEFHTRVRAGADGGGRFVDGSRARLDLPQVWRFGIGWPAAPALRLSAGVNLYREGAARMDLLDDPAAGIDARRDYRDSWEGAAALAWRLDERRLLRAGILYTRIGQGRAAVLDTSPPGAHADYLSLAAGGCWQLTPRLRANAGVAWTAFVRPLEQADGAGDRALRDAYAAAGLAIEPRKRYDKRYLTLALGVEWRLPL